METFVTTIVTAAVAAGDIVAGSIFPTIPDEVASTAYPLLIFTRRATTLTPQDILKTGYLVAPDIDCVIVTRKADTGGNDFTEIERVFKALALQLITDDPEFHPTSVEYVESFFSTVSVLVAKITFARPVSTYVLTP